MRPMVTQQSRVTMQKGWRTVPKVVMQDNAVYYGADHAAYYGANHGAYYGADGVVYNGA